MVGCVCICNHTHISYAGVLSSSCYLIRVTCHTSPESYTPRPFYSSLSLCICLCRHISRRRGFRLSHSVCVCILGAKKKWDRFVIRLPFSPLCPAAVGQIPASSRRMGGAKGANEDDEEKGWSFFFWGERSVLVAAWSIFKLYPSFRQRTASFWVTEI